MEKLYPVTDEVRFQHFEASTVTRPENEHPYFLIIGVCSVIIIGISAMIYYRTLSDQQKKKIRLGY